jgi:hypothetical protein
MKTARTLIGFLIGFVALAGRPAPGCVVERTSLWEKIKNAELIAFARVEKLEQEIDRSPGAALVGSEDGFDRDVAVLKILGTWKAPAGSEVRLNYSGGLYAGGRRVVAGDEILVFLESGETQIRRFREAKQASPAAPESFEADAETTESVESSADQDHLRQWEESRTGRWFLTGYGSAVLAVESADMDPLRGLLAEAVRLQAGSPVPDETPRAWLAKAAGLRTTRADALEDLRLLVERPESEESVPGTSRLSEEELRTIADGFVGEPSADWSVPALLELLSGYEDDAFDRAVISVIEAGVNAPRIPSWVPEAVRRLIVRSGWRDWGVGIWERHRADGTLKEIWPAVAKELGLPSVPPAVLPIDRAEGEQASE